MNLGGFGEILFDEPVSEVSLFYASFVPVTLEAFDANGNMVAPAATGPANLQFDPPVVNVWDLLTVDAGTNSVVRVILRGERGLTAVDDLTYCQRTGIRAAIVELEAVAQGLERTPGVGNFEDALESLDEAIALLTASLGSFDPNDPDRLIVGLGEDFFDNVEDAVEEIFDAIEEGEITNTDILAELENIVVNKILEAVRVIAETAINDAVDAGGDPEEIADAQDEFATAEQQTADCASAGVAALEFCDDAVGSFEDAWEEAKEA